MTNERREFRLRMNEAVVEYPRDLGDQAEAEALARNWDTEPPFPILETRTVTDWISIKGGVDGR